MVLVLVTSWLQVDFKGKNRIFLRKPATPYPVRPAVVTSWLQIIVINKTK